MTFDMFRNRGRRARFAPQADPFAVPQELLVGYDNIQPSGFLEPGSVNIATFASGLRPVQIVSSLPALPDAIYPVGSVVYLTTDGKIYRNVADVWTAEVSAADGGVEPVATLPTLPDAAYPVNSVVILTTNGKIYRNIANVWVTAIDGADILADTITANQIATGTITANEIATNTITSNEIAANAITASELATDSVVAGKIQAGAVSTDELAAEAVTTEKLAAGQITLFDSDGQTQLDPDGFGANWQRFLWSGFKNGDFVSLPPTPGSDIDNSTNPLPHWPFTKSSGTAITARSVADLSSGSERALQFTMASGAANDKSYIEQIYPIISTKNRAYSFSPYAFAQSSAGNVDAEAFFELQFLTRSGGATGSTFTAFLATSTINAVGGAELGLSGTGTIAPPADAYFARVRYGLRRKSGGSTSATSTMQFNEVSMLVGHPRLHVPEITTPGTYSRGSIGQFGGQISIIPDALYSGTDARGVAINYPGVLRGGGTTFPTNPSEDDLFYRTDFDMWFWYDAVRWNCVCLHTVELSTATGPITANTVLWAGMQHLGGTDLNIKSMYTTFFIGAGGSALSGSHKWVGVTAGSPGTETVNIDSGASEAWRTDTQAINALESSGGGIQVANIQWTKTGTPGSLLAFSRITYYIVTT